MHDTNNTESRNKQIDATVAELENKSEPICFWPGEYEKFSNHHPFPNVPTAKVDSKKWVRITQFERDPFDNTYFGKQIEAIVKGDADHERCGWTRNGDCLTLWHKAESIN